MEKCLKLRWQGSSLIGYLSTITGISIMATVEVTTKLIQADITPYQINFFRTFLGSGFLLLMTLILGADVRGFVKRNLGKVLLMALLWNVIGLNLYFLAITWTSASHAALIFSVNPVIASILAVMVLHENLTLYKVLGGLTGLIGVIAVITRFDINFLKFGTLYGDLLMAIPLVLWCVYLVWGVSWTAKEENHRRSHLRDQLNYLSSTFAFGLLLLVPIFILDTLRSPVHLSNDTLAYLIYLGLATNGVAYILYFWGVSKLEVSKGTIAFFLKPVIASILSFIILGEDIFSGSFIIGAILVSLAVFVTSRSE